MHRRRSVVSPSDDHVAERLQRSLLWTRPPGPFLSLHSTTHLSRLARSFAPFFAFAPSFAPFFAFAPFLFLFGLAGAFAPFFALALFGFDTIAPIIAPFFINHPDKKMFVAALRPLFVVVSCGASVCPERAAKGSVCLVTCADLP